MPQSDITPKDHPCAGLIELGKEYRDEELLPIFKWLLGYEDFPERKDGDGAYYWRIELRKKLEKAGIKIQ